jgi:invasion protein IalB
MAAMRFRRALALSAALAPAAAGAADLLDTFNDWSAFAAAEGGNKVCYAGSEPKKQAGDYARRDETYVLVTQRPADQAFDVVSVNAGYAYRKGSEVTVSIGGDSFQLFTDGAHAYAFDAKADKALVEAMKRGASMTVVGTSSRGTPTTDTYSLIGFTAAHQAALKACGLGAGR